MDASITRILEDTIEWIEENDFALVYTYAYQLLGRENDDGTKIGLLSKTLSDAGIDVLSYVAGVPRYYMFGQKVPETLILPSNIKEINMKSFAKTAGLKKVVFSSSINAVRMFAFAHCKELIEVHIQGPNTQIASGAFTGCYNLETITFEGPKKQFTRNCIEGFKGIHPLTVICTDEIFTILE